MNVLLYCFCLAGTQNRDRYLRYISEVVDGVFGCAVADIGRHIEEVQPPLFGCYCMAAASTSSERSVLVGIRKSSQYSACRTG